MTKLEAEFIDLVHTARPMQEQLAEITAKQVQLADQINREVIEKAFPGIDIKEVVAVAEIRPTDMGNGARTTVERLKELGITPSRALHDTQRMVFILLR